MSPKLYRSRIVLSIVVLSLIAFTAVKFVSYAQKKVSAPSAPAITATETLTDPVSVGGNNDSKAQPGETLLATVTITNTGSDATGVSLSDVPIPTLSPNGVGGAFVIGPVAAPDSYETIGNTQLEVSGAQTIGTGVFVSGNVKNNDVDPAGN